MKLDQMLKTALDELRMQMLGAQVLFGFQFQGIFQSGFDDVSDTARKVNACALGLMALTIGILIAAPAQHRLVERGRSTFRIHRVATRCAQVAPLPFALSIACDFFVVTDRQFGARPAVAAAIAALLAALALWYGLSVGVRARLRSEDKPMTPTVQESNTPLHIKIQQMLTESRVILPGAQALLGFQLVVTMTQAFDRLDEPIRVVHFVSLACVAFAVIMLIAPAAVHRIAFHGEDAEAFHRMGSTLVTLALIPLALGLSGDVYVAGEQMFSGSPVGWIGATVIGTLLFGLWYGVPWWVRRRIP